jgi:hypothetical protein
MNDQTLPVLYLAWSLYYAIIIVRYEWPHTALNITVHRGLYLGIIINEYEGPHTAQHCPYNSLTWWPILSHYDGPV